MGTANCFRAVSRSLVLKLVLPNERRLARVRLRTRRPSPECPGGKDGPQKECGAEKRHGTLGGYKSGGPDPLLYGVDAATGRSHSRIRCGSFAGTVYWGCVGKPQLSSPPTPWMAASRWTVVASARRRS